MNRSDLHQPTAEPTPGLAAELAALAVDPPRRLLDRVVARWVRVPGPLGAVYVACTDRGVAYLRTDAVVGDDPAAFRAAFRDRFGRPLLPAVRPPAGLLPALRTGRATGLRLDLTGLTEFEQAVLGAAGTIPAGQVRPYRWVAGRIGRPAAVRAVGSALRRNPVPLLIPCHRVIRADGTLGDYVFGRDAKRRLLDAEGANLDEVHDLARRGVHYLGSDTTGVVCFPSCPNARRISAAHRHGFGTLAAAERAGYRPCRQCRPAGVG